MKLNRTPLPLPSLHKASLVVGALLIAASAVSVQAFCGFYVGKADSKLFNKASKVVIARDGDTTVLTMANDYQGDLKEFAAVFPVPVVPKKEDIKVVPNKIIEKLDAYSAPRIVEYHDPDPCALPIGNSAFSSGGAPMALSVRSAPVKAPPVKIEAQYSVEEYEILILSSEDSKGLETWLTQEGYKIPAGASKVLGSYIKQHMKFFVAKVNLDKQADLGYTTLRPLQVRYQSKKFALPIRLGTVNAAADQEILAFMLSPNGRVECTNYKTEKLPTGMDLPQFVRGEFKDFYRDMFYYQVAKAKKKAVFMEYGWDMGWCDPCAGDPLTPSEQLTLGCRWVSPDEFAGTADNESNYRVKSGDTLFAIARKNKVSVQQLRGRNNLRGSNIAAGATLVIPSPDFRPVGALTRPTYITRLHAVYNAETFPEDLVFQATSDKQNFQGRYVLKTPWKGKADACPGAKTYLDQLKDLKGKRVDNLVELTGWDLAECRKKAGL